MFYKRAVSSTLIMTSDSQRDEMFFHNIFHWLHLQFCFWSHGIFFHAHWSKDTNKESKLHLLKLTIAQRNLWWWLRRWAWTLRAWRNPLSALLQSITGHGNKPELAWLFMCAERLDLCLNFDPHWWHLKPATLLCDCNKDWTT